MPVDDVPDRCGIPDEERMQMSKHGEACGMRDCTIPPEMLCKTCGMWYCSIQFKHHVKQFPDHVRR